MKYERYSKNEIGSVAVNGENWCRITTVRKQEMGIWSLRFLLLKQGCNMRKIEFRGKWIDGMEMKINEENRSIDESI
jgi:hypothetical protein